MDPLKIDSHKLEFHPHRVAQWLDAKDDWEKAKKVYPIYVEVSPMGACNHRCTFCAVDYIGYKAVSLDEEILIDRLEEMYLLGVKSVMFAGEGEPLLHKGINAITQNAIGSGLDVAFTTNGVLLDKLDLDGVSWVKVSLNAGTRATYAKVHRTKEKDWDRVWENLRDAVKRKGDCTIGVQMVCLPENAGEEQELQARCEDVGVDYCVLKPYSQHKMSITKQYEGYKPINLVGGKNVIVREEAIKTEGHAYDKCNATPFYWAYIMATGEVYSCSAYLLDKRFRLGNINDHSFREIWESPERFRNWELVRKTLDISECRVNCRMDKANRYLWGFDHQQHVNFV
jgi:radical SAM protein with 4Fe4S-binding SPASM domain